MKTEWSLAGGADQLGMMRAASEIINHNRPPACPVCGQPQLRFYYHEFRKRPRRSGTIWVWCAACGKWDHVSRIELPAHYHYDDPFAAATLEEFDRLERAGWLDRLNLMWEREALPQRFTLG